jgi:hypothetical protein
MLELKNPAMYEVTQRLNLMKAEKYSLEGFELGYGTFKSVETWFWTADDQLQS